VTVSWAAAGVADTAAQTAAADRNVTKKLFMVLPPKSNPRAISVAAASRADRLSSSRTARHDFATIAHCSKSSRCFFVLHRHTWVEDEAYFRKRLEFERAK
jgi:hypothetical protein